MEDQKENFFVELAKAKAQSQIKIEQSPKREMSRVVYEETGEEGQLTVDVYQDKNDIVVQSTVAGVDPDDLEIHITSESVTVKGRRERIQRIEERDYFYQECFWGRFSRSIMLPGEVDPEESTATLNNGILTIRMPRLEKHKIKKLKVVKN